MRPRVIDWLAPDGKRHTSRPLALAAAADLRRELQHLGHPHTERAATDEEMQAEAARRQEEAR
jgi:hypothetical protein